MDGHDLVLLDQEVGASGAQVRPEGGASGGHPGTAPLLHHPADARGSGEHVPVRVVDARAAALRSRRAVLEQQQLTAPVGRAVEAGDAAAPPQRPLPHARAELPRALVVLAGHQQDVALGEGRHVRDEEEVAVAGDHAGLAGEVRHAVEPEAQGRAQDAVVLGLVPRRRLGQASSSTTERDHSPSSLPAAGGPCGKGYRHGTSGVQNLAKREQKGGKATLCTRRLLPSPHRPPAQPDPPPRRNDSGPAVPALRPSTWPSSKPG